MPNPFSPLRIIIILDNASGVQFPAAKNVRPITASGIRKVSPKQKHRLRTLLNIVSLQLARISFWKNGVNELIELKFEEPDDKSSMVF